MCTDSCLRIALQKQELRKENARLYDRGVGVSIFVSNPDNNWKPPAHRLIARIESEWANSNQLSCLATRIPRSCSFYRISDFCRQQRKVETNNDKEASVSDK
jgi:hypothetical protein